MPYLIQINQNIHDGPDLELYDDKSKSVQQALARLSTAASVGDTEWGASGDPAGWKPSLKAGDTVHIWTVDGLARRYDVQAVTQLRFERRPSPAPGPEAAEPVLVASTDGPTHRRRLGLPDVRPEPDESYTGSDFASQPEP